VRRYTFTLLLALLSVGATAVVRADALRCGSRIVVTGDSRSQLHALCGDPEDVETQRILAQPSYFRHGRRYFVSGDEVEILVEYWTYNFGTQKLMRRIRIEDGIVTDMETLGYGHN
jgi:Protein of unknown function (DUF2845)